MFLLATSACLLLSTTAYAQTTITTRVDADGETDTYELINNILAPGYDVCETPDCGHEEFGPHITQEFDEGLGYYVFRFHMHHDLDDDRCIESYDDRQRNEIKTYDQSPCYLYGTPGETHTYNWMFRLPADFQVSPNWTHIHQVKIDGGDLEMFPLCSLTLRYYDYGDQWELRMTNYDDVETIIEQGSLDDMRGHWVTASETLTYGEEEDGGYYHITMSNEDGTFLDYEEYRRMWKDGCELIRPKWGIYRKLQEIWYDFLKDETLDFAYFELVGPTDCLEDIDDDDDDDDKKN